MPQPIDTVSNVNNTPQDIGPLSDTSISDPPNYQFSSPIPTQAAGNPFNTPQGPVTNFQLLLSQAHWNHSFIIVNSSPSFQISIPLSFQIIPPKNTLILNSHTPDPDQHSHQCIGKQPDTTRTYPTLTLNLTQSLLFSHTPFSQIVTTANNYLIGSNKGLLNQATSFQFKNNDLHKHSNISFSVEIIVEQDKLICQPRAAVPPIFRVKINPLPFICHHPEIPYKFDRYTKNAAGCFVFYNPHSGVSHTCPLKI